MKTLIAAALWSVCLAVSGLAPARAGEAGTTTPRVIKIRAGAGNTMTFDVTSLHAAPGELVTVMLTNAGTLPKTVMGHNWILLLPGSDPVAFSVAGLSEAEHSYIPAKLKGQIVAFIPMLGPGETGEVTFSVPAAPGEYPFLCAFPSHCLVGMKGVLVVK